MSIVESFKSQFKAIRDLEKQNAVLTHKAEKLQARYEKLKASYDMMLEKKREERAKRREEREQLAKERAERRANREARKAESTAVANKRTLRSGYANAKSAVRTQKPRKMRATKKYEAFVL